MTRLMAVLAAWVLLFVGIPAASLAQGLPRPGAPCPRAGMTYEVDGKVLECKKRKGKLIWVVQAGTGGDMLDQKAPANGVWKVPPGYPTDLPPFGWRGEPTWFKPEWEVITTRPIGKCPGPTPLTHLPADLSEIDAITGQGFMQPGSHALPVPHMYYATKPDKGIDEQGFPTVSRLVDVIAPADMTLRSVGLSITSYQGRPRTEYMLNFSVCGTLWFFTAHLGTVNDGIARAYPRAPRQECFDTGISGAPPACLFSYLSLKVRAGDVIGTSSGYSAGFDFGLADASAPVAGRLDPSAYSPRWSTSRCHLDYFTAELKAKLTPLLTGDNGCGQLVSDRAMTPSGVWLALGKRELSHRENLHIALARHWSDRDLRVFSIGWDAQVPGLPGGRYLFTPRSSGNNRDFTLIGPGETVCYDDLTAEWRQDGGPAAQAIYITMTTGKVETLRIAGAPGECPPIPTMPEQFQQFERRNTTR